MSRPRRVLVSMESRATIGYSENVLRKMQQCPAFEIATLVTGMHLIEELGNSIELIHAMGLPVTAQVEMHAVSQHRSAWSVALGEAIAGYAKAFGEIEPDIVLLSGDRVETFGCCVAAAYMGLPIAHIQAGDKSGHIDDSARHAIARFAHIHFAACEDSAERLRRAGEQDFRIFNVGAPQLDSIVGRDFRAATITVDNVVFDLREPYLLVVQHPVLSEVEGAYHQMSGTLEGCLSTGMRVVWIYPNSDLGYKQIVRVMDERGNHPRLTVFRNLDRDDYLRLLANCAALVGNSSSGLLEAPSFKVPVVNVGSRQRGRLQASNVLNAANDAVDIARALRTALHDETFRAACSQAVNPNGDGSSSERICKILAEIPLDDKLLTKEVTY